MPYVKLEVTIYDRSLGYMDHRDSFIVECKGEFITKVLFLRAAKKLLQILVKWNKRKKGKSDTTTTTTTSTTTTTT